MSTQFRLQILSQLTSISLVLWLAVVSLAAPAQLGVVQTVMGTVTVQRSGTTSAVAAATRTPLYVGDAVSTGANSKAMLLFLDGAQVRLNANTRVLVVARTAVGKGKRGLFRVVRGEVSARLRPGQAAVTNTAIAGVRGTEINLQVAEDDTTTLTVIEGEVEFFNTFGEVIVQQSQQSRARPGSAPTAPVTIQNADIITEWSVDLNRAIIPREKHYYSLDQQAVAAETRRRAALVQSKATDAVAHLSYGDILFDGRQYGYALREYQEANRLAPNGAATWTRIGHTLLELDRLDEAETAYRTASTVATQPAGVQTVAWEAGDESAYAPALVGLSWIALTRNRPAEAQARAKQALAVVSTQVTAHSTAMASGNGEGSAATEAVEARVALGLALMRQPGQLNEAAQAFDAASTEPTKYTYQARAWRAMVYLAQNDQTAALKEAQAATQMQPQSGLAHGNLALIYFYSGQPQAARREAHLAVRLDPDSVAARVALGQAALAQGDVDTAEREAAQAVALDPALPQAHYLLGVADAGRRDYTHAARSLEASMRLEPEFLPAVSALARVYNNMGRSDDAVRMLNDLLPNHRNTDEVRAALGAVYYEQGKYSSAADQYREAVQARPGSALYQAELARTFIYSNRLDAAINAAQMAVLLAPEVGQYHATLGLAYEFSGLSSRAEREYRNALTRDPRNALALARLAFLGSNSDLQPSQSLFREPLRRDNRDLRPAEASITQAFLFSPSIPRQLLRGGINMELTPRMGDQSQRTLNFLHQLQAGDGKFHTLGILGRSQDNGSRTNDDTRDLGIAEYATLVPNARTNLYFNLLGQQTRRGLTGADSTPDADDRFSFRFGRTQIAMRHRMGTNNFLWLGLFGNTSRSTTVDNGLNSFRDVATGLPVQRQRIDSDALLPEVRLDFSLGKRPSRPSLLTIGVARASTSFDSRRDLQVAFPGATGTASFNQDDRSLLTYAQLSQRVSERFNFIGQLRAERLRDTRSEVVSLPGSLPAFTNQQQTRTRVLPGFLATYQVDKRTALRFAFNRRQTDITTSTFAPNDTLLTNEIGTLPFGTPDDLRLLHVDVERYLSPRSFIKLFAFRSTAGQVDIGATDLLGFGNGLPAPLAPRLTVRNWQAAGAGIRLEHQVSRRLFANFSFVARKTENTTVGPLFNTVFSGNNAPYEPKRLASFELHHIDSSGNKVGLRLRHTGSFFQDAPTSVGRPRFGSQTYFDLLLAKEPSVNHDLFLNITNVFNQSQVQFNDFRSGRRRVSLGVTNRF